MYRPSHGYTRLQSSRVNVNVAGLTVCIFTELYSPIQRQYSLEEGKYTIRRQTTEVWHYSNFCRRKLSCGRLAFLAFWDQFYSENWIFTFSAILHIVQCFQPYCALSELLFVF